LGKRKEKSRGTLWGGKTKAFITDGVVWIGRHVRVDQEGRE